DAVVGERAAGPPQGKVLGPVVVELVDRADDVADDGSQHAALPQGPPLPPEGDGRGRLRPAPGSRLPAPGFRIRDSGFGFRQGSFGSGIFVFSFSDFRNSMRSATSAALRSAFWRLVLSRKGLSAPPPTMNFTASSSVATLPSWK